MTYASDPDPGLLERLRRRLAPHVDRLNIRPEWVIPLVCVAIGFRAVRRGGWGAKIIIGASDSDIALYHNAIVFARLMLPFWLGLGMRWRGRGHGKEFWQFGLGWKPNGQFGVNWRIQSDASAARGTTGPNHGQAVGWWEGPK
jgi:hypothetical protein